MTSPSDLDIALLTQQLPRGGFVRRGMATLLAGVEDEQVEPALQVIRQSLSPAPEPGGFSGRPPPPDIDFPLADLTGILRGHLRLGFRPCPLTLAALRPVIRRQLAQGSETPGAAAVLLASLAELGASPGDAILELLLACLEDGAGAEALAAARAQAEQLGYHGC